MIVENMCDFMKIGTLSAKDKERFLEEANKENAKYIMIVCDVTDYEDYPIFIKNGEDYTEIYEEYSLKSMQKVMGIYYIWR
jgi:hypothetical protein